MALTQVLAAYGSCPDLGWLGLPAGMAQGIGFHAEYKSCSAVLVEIDCREKTVHRPIRDGVGGPLGCITVRV